MNTPNVYVAGCDEPTNEIICEFLHTFDYKIIGNTQFAFNCIEDVVSNPPDIIIMDSFIYDLPVCDLAMRLSEMQISENILIVCITKVKDSSLVNEFRANGGDMYVLLPTDFMTLDKNIRKALELKRTK